MCVRPQTLCCARCELRRHSRYDACRFILSAFARTAAYVSRATATAPTDGSTAASPRLPLHASSGLCC
eukprot:67730-Pleurochrysis_carterae.AAC.1